MVQGLRIPIGFTCHLVQADHCYPCKIRFFCRINTEEDDEASFSDTRSSIVLVSDDCRSTPSHNGDAEPTIVRKRIDLVEGDALELKIPYEGLQRPRCEWRREGCLVDCKAGRLQVALEAGRALLHVDDARKEDSGEYELRLIDAGGKQAIVRIDLRVTGKCDCC